jgi:hypothetical protein
MHKCKKAEKVLHQKMKAIIFSSLLSVSIFLDFLCPYSAMAQQLFIQGSWTDKEKDCTYSFLKDNGFRFRKRLNWSTEKKRTEDDPKETDGVWRYGEEICWAGPAKGNLMIYADTMQCCMLAQIIGGKLVLTEIWEKGHCDFNICNNRLLTKVKSKSEK